MTQKRWPLLMIVLVLSLIIYWLKDREKSTHDKPLHRSTTTSQTVHQQSYTRSLKKERLEHVKPVSQPRHVRLMTEFLKSSALRPDMPSVLAHLQKLQTQPTYFQDSNPSTGSLYVIRTEKPLPGTRYFHAQYFSDENKKPFLQHMSFEIPPGKNSLQVAAQNVKSVFPNLNHPEIQKEGFILWKWKGGYNVWIMRLTKDQLTGDPFNAYTEQDEGTVRIAMELDIGDGHNHE